MGTYVQYKYVRPCNTRTEMYAGYIVCCPLVSHVEYAPQALLRLEKDRTDGWMDGRTPDGYIMFATRRGQCDNMLLIVCYTCIEHISLFIQPVLRHWKIGWSRWDDLIKRCERLFVCSLWCQQVKLMSCKVEKIHTFMDYIKGGSVFVVVLIVRSACAKDNVFRYFLKYILRCFLLYSFLKIQFNLCFFLVICKLLFVKDSQLTGGWIRLING